MNQIQAKQFNGQELLTGMKWDMGGTWVENKEGKRKYVMPGDWLMGEPGDYTEVLSNTEFLNRFSVETIIKPINKSTMQEQELTFGMKAVGLDFNPSGKEEVVAIKKSAAAYIDILDGLRNATTNGEVKRQISVAITEAQTSQMWAVKAVTWQY